MFRFILKSERCRIGSVEEREIVLIMLRINDFSRPFSP